MTNNELKNVCRQILTLLANALAEDPTSIKNNVVKMSSAKKRFSSSCGKAQSNIQIENSLKKEELI